MVFRAALEIAVNAQDVGVLRAGDALVQILDVEFFNLAADCERGSEALAAFLDELLVQRGKFRVSKFARLGIANRVRDAIAIQQGFDAGGMGGFTFLDIQKNRRLPFGIQRGVNVVGELLFFTHELQVCGFYCAQCAGWLGGERGACQECAKDADQRH